MTPWEKIKPSIKKLLLREIIFEKKNLFNVYDKTIKKELNLQIFNTRHYFIENFLDM